MNYMMVRKTFWIMDRNESHEIMFCVQILKYYNYKILKLKRWMIGNSKELCQMEISGKNV